MLPDSPLSYWLDTYGAYTPSPSLQGELKVDVAVIGGGFTGAMTAYEIKRAEPSLKVALLEARTAGYGASGRNGSFAMTVVGLGFSTTALLHGKGFLKDAHTYMMQAVECLDDLIQRENLDCDRRRPGFLRVATTPTYIRRLQEEVELMNRLNFDDLSWLDAQQVRSRVNSDAYLGGMWEPRLLLVDPARLVRGEMELARKAGVHTFENTPVLQVSPRSPYQLQTPLGAIMAEKVAYATNAYSRLFRPLRRLQIPAFTYMVATEPLSQDQLAAINWSGGEGLEDARNLIHYYRITPGKRIVMGGGPVGITYAGRLDHDRNPSAWKHLENHIHFLFPQLKGIRITHRWGGPFSVTAKLVPSMGYAGDRSAVYSLGCVGHGVSMSHLNAQVLRDLLLEHKTSLTESPFVKRKPLPWPPEPLSYTAAAGLRAGLQLEDSWHERSLSKAAR